MREKIVKVVSVSSIIMLCCTLLCGIWVGTHENCDIGFHAMLSGASVIVAIIS